MARIKLVLKERDIKAKKAEQQSGDDAEPAAAQA